MVLGEQLHVLDEVDSTNLEAKRRAAEGAPMGTVVTARRQTAGYGQRGRDWASPADAGLYMSILLPVPPKPTHLPFVLGLGCVDGLAAWSAEVRLKWVNDVVARGRKLGGMLVELQGGVAIAGIGLNLQTPDVEDAIGLAELTSTPPDLDTLRDAVLRGIERRIAVWERDGFERVRADWRSRSITIGTHVRVTGIDPEVVGLAQSLGPEGELMVRVEDTIVPVHTGTVRTIDGQYC